MLRPPLPLCLATRGTMHNGHPAPARLHPHVGTAEKLIATSVRKLLSGLSVANGSD